jgi:hypothetical protein
MLAVGALFGALVDCIEPFRVEDRRSQIAVLGHSFWGGELLRSACVCSVDGSSRCVHSLILFARRVDCVDKRADYGIFENPGLPDLETNKRRSIGTSAFRRH